MINIEDVKSARERIDEVTRGTHLLHSMTRSGENDVYLKIESLQRTGSFKIRGAFNKVASLTDEEKAKGTITASNGNHAQAVALASSLNGVKCKVCMSEKALMSRMEDARRHGADVIVVPGEIEDAVKEAKRLADEKGYIFIGRDEDDLVMAGNGTVGLEVIEQMPDLDAVVVPVGTGTLLAGIAVAVKAVKPDCKVYGVQATGASAMSRSFRKGEVVSIPHINTFASGIAVLEPSRSAFEVIKEKVDGIITVTEDEIASAMLALLEKQKILAEGAGAVTAAAVMFDKIPESGKKIACIISGGNVDINVLNRVIARGLMMNDRRTNITIQMDDKQGTLARACNIISECGGNILEVHHDRGESNIQLTSCYVTFELETKDATQARLLRETLEAEGYQLVRQ